MIAPPTSFLSGLRLSDLSLFACLRTLQGGETRNLASRLIPDAVALPGASNVPRAHHLVDVLRERAGQPGQAPAYTFLDEGEAEGGTLSWEALDRSARAIAVRLSEVARPGDRALLLFPAGLDFIAAFFGCLYAGVVAVPSYPPRPNRGQDRGQNRLRAIARDASPTVVLAGQALLPRAAGLIEDVPELAAARWIASDDRELLDGGAAESWRDPGIRPEDLAFLQYTSGSTSLPKGVRVSHANLVANERMIAAAFRQTEESVVVGWLPLYHDMGLIGNVLQPLWSGGRCVLMSPVAFLQKPLRWLAAISRYGATTSGGPNFAYDLCARKISEAERAGLDLSRWRVAYNGAEPVRKGTLDRFAAAFAGCGFSPEAFYPCYGLAEATLFAAGGVPETGARAIRFEAEELRHGRAVAVEPQATAAPAAAELVSSGGPWLEQRLAIVDPESREELPEGRVGEIWIAGPNVGGGYWGRPEATVETFEAITAAGAGPYLRTGDLGFRHGADLFVAGRRKDLIILRGRNLYPQDLEATAEAAHPALRAGNGAAFSVGGTGGEGDDAERLVLVYEVDRRAGPEVHEAAAAAVRTAIAEEHEAQVADLVLVKIGGVPKTSSGKVQRHACREGYLAGTLPVVARSAAAPGADETSEETAPEPGRDELAALPAPSRRRALEGLLASWAARALGVSAARLAHDAPLSSYGLDSLAALELRSAVEERLGVALPLATLFEGATLGDLATLIAADLETGAALPAAAVAPAAPSEGETFPLSYGQEGLWVTERLAPGSGAYNLAAAFRVTGAEADWPDRLEAALLRIIAHHPALRLRLEVTEGEPRQRLAAPGGAGDLDFAVEDLAGRSEEAALAELSAAAYRPFDLSRGPLLRARGLRGPEGGLLLFAVHHSAVDFAALGTLARDLATLLLGGALAPLAPEGGYPAWVREQRERLAGPAGEGLRAFWRERLGAGIPDLDLPADRPRPPAPSYEGAVAATAIARETVARLEALARKRGTTLQAALLAGFAGELALSSGQDGFGVGLPTAGRSRSRFAQTVGYFVNPVVVRARTEGEPAFRALLERTRDELLGALEHADDPFPLLAAELVPARDAARSPLFQAMFVHHVGRHGVDAALAEVALGEGGARLDLPGLSLVSLALPGRRAQFDLTLRSAAAPSGAIQVVLEASADLFDAATAARLLDRFARLIGAASAAPETPLSSLPRLAPAEAHQLRVEWNDRGVGARADLCLHELFAAQAARTPEAEALLAGPERLTYGELARRVSRLAARLAARGAGPEVRVAVCLNRSADLVTALLAVMSAGSAYVPLDPTYPRERLALMLADSGSKLLITEGACLSALPESLPETLRLDVAAAAAEPAEVRGVPLGRAVPGNLAYLIYTSGSTGVPKAVAIEHRSVVAFARWARRELSDRELSGVAAVTSVCFDLSVFELFVPICWGGRTILAENALALPSHPAREEISLINTVPSAMAELARLPVAFPSLRAVILAGEPLPGELVERIYRMAEPGDGPARAVAGLTVRNLYGPSEDTTYSTGAVIPRGAARPSIGRPVEGTRVYLLDRSGRPTPLGVPGELLLGGAGLARGYLGRPAMTAERFVPDPFAGPEEGGARLYRTGDLARYRADGELEFLGRIDNQVKIRGFRIELGEIEAALLAHPQVAECVVVANDGRLVAYLAGSAAEQGDLSTRLPEFLGRTLPAYMIPFAFVVLPALPRSANGKVDRKALPAPRFEVEGAARPPADEVERRLALLFAEVLEVESVGLDDDFFGRGGHSLAAMRLLSRVERELGTELPARALFEAPTVARLAERVREGARAADLPIERIADEERGQPLPASFAQRRIWFLERLDPGRATYHLPGRLSLSGALDVAALGAALRAVVVRHEALRTGFEARRNGPVQIVLPEAPIALPVVDLASLGDALRRAEADRAAGLAARQPFDLARPPLVRALLVSLCDRHELILNLHHLISDGWSLGLLAEEIGAGYGGRALPPLPVQVADAAVWERRLLSGGFLEREERSWAARLAEPPAALDLPVKAGATGVRGARLERPLALNAAAFAAAARRLGATPFMALAAAWGAVLGRFGASDDLLLGTPVSVRTRPELEPLIGCFVNTVALRVDLSGDPSFGTQVERLRAVCLEAYAHRHLPYDRLVELLRPEGSGLGASPFQAFVVLDEGLPRPHLPGLDARLEPLFTGTAKFDLTLALERREGGALAAALEYASDRIEPVAAGRILEGFLRLFEGAMADPGRRLGELPLLAESEREQLARWGSGPEVLRAEPGPVLLDDLVARWERETPGATAVADSSGSLTYAQLGDRANRLAWRLRALGAAEDSRVAVCLERSVDLIVAELAALRAGAAYAPIDPAYPEERRADMVALSGARVVITRSELLGAWCGADRGVQILRIDAPDEAAGDDKPMPPPPVLRDPDRLAYAIFTSGSSGRPKGVAMSHRGALHIVSWHLSRYGWSREDRGGQIAAPSFDAAVIEIWPALASGASLHVPPAEVRLSATAQLDWLARERVTIAWVPTVIAEGIVALPPPPGLALRHLTTGGDRLHRGTAPGSPFSLSNEYGPAENAVISTQSVPVGAAAPSIGRPIDGVSVYVLDRRLDPAPAGASGELVVTGDGLARGYLADPGQTAERFVPDPRAARPGARMYRTGDRVRFRPDGEVDFLGRLDAQVKIRGQRIELGEIEAALLAEPGVAEAAVRVREGASGDRRLAAYLVPAPAAEGAVPLDDRRLIEALARRLADAMVPRVYLRLATLPMTANGKVDSRALAALPLPAATGGLPPRNEGEARLAAIWADLLNVESVGVEDDFFALGGHSLLAAQLAYRLSEELGVEVPVAVLFSAPTVAQLARWLAERRLLLVEPAGEAIPRVSREAPLPLSVAQERLWFLEELEGPSALHHIAAGFAGEGRLDAAALRSALSGLWSRHEALRARFAVVRGEPVQTFAPGGELPLPRIDLSALFGPALSGAGRAESEAERLGLAAAREPFALGRGPLLRARLATLGPERFRLALVVHHLVADGVSVGILEGELSDLYRAAVERRPAALSDLPCQYADFAVWQRGRLATDAATTEAEIEFWRAELSDLPPLALPTDRAPGGGSRHLGRTLTFSLGGESPPGLSLPDLARRAGTTPFVALLAGFAAALARFSGQERFGLGVPEAGRPRGEAERLVGLFVNTLVVPVDLEDDPSGADLAVRLRARLAAALAHSTTPFERLVEALAPERDRERTPFFQVMVAARPEAEKRLALPGVKLAPEALETGSAKFDLTLLADAAAGPGGSAAIEYDAGRFDAATVERWIGQFGRLAADLAARPEARLSDLALLSAAEREQLLAAATGPQETPIGGGTLLLDDLVARWETETPGALAVADAAGTATYAELGARANALAWRLHELGVAEDAVVAVCLDRSVGLIAAELGVLRAGAAYAPIDPAYPEERRAGMVAAANAAAVVTLSSLAGDWASGRPLVLLDRPDEGGAPPAGAPPVLRDPDRLAYAIFTSGTTGRPKCVAMSHRGALHIVLWHLARFGWTPADRGTQVSGPSFDAAVIEIWPALAAGASLHVPEGESRLVAADLLAWLARERLTIAWAPTPLVERMAAEAAPPDLALRFLQTGGDRLRRGAPEGAGFLLCNQYGPAENAVITTQGESAATLDASGPPPGIGRPIAGVRAYLLDRRLGLASHGAPGELAAAGGGLARGYLGDPRQTAERFVPDPFSGQAGARMYRTGDLARLRRDGALEFVGRADTQVKIRGQRIELGEIEGAILALPGVREAAVAVRETAALEGGSIERSLVAFVVAPDELPDRDLIAPLRARLAEAMVPRRFVRLGALPTTANGKLDRRALARLAAGGPDLRRAAGRIAAPADGSAAPRGAFERRVAALFGEALGQAEVSRHDDFFALGGHSLLAPKVILPLRAELGWRVPLAALFENPTVADLAAWLSDAGPEAKLFFPPEREGAIEPVPRSPEMPLSPAQERLWFIEQLEGPSPQYHIPGSFRVEGRLDRSALSAALDRLVARHEALRARFAMSGAGPVQSFAPPGRLALPEADLQALPADSAALEADRLLAAAVERPFDLGRGPLLRVLVVALGAERSRLGLAVHHLVADGVSFAILEGELSELYAAAVAGRPAHLAPLSLQYADFAVWRRQRFDPEKIALRVAEQAAELETASEPLELPTDRPRPPVSRHRGAYREIGAWLDGEAVRRAVAGLGNARGATPYQVWFALFSALLGRLSGRPSFLLGLPVSGRVPGTEGIVGLFADTRVIRVDLDPDPTGAELIERSRERLLASEARGEVPFDRLVEALPGSRDRSVAPLYQASLVARVARGGLSLPGVELVPSAVGTATAKRDLTLFVDGGEAGEDVGAIEYDVDLFDPPTIERFVAQLGRLAVAVAARPEERLSNLDLIAPSERHQLLVEINERSNPGVPSPPGVTYLDQLSEIWERETPDAVAVVDAWGTITYGELKRRAERLARRLVALGVTEEERVAICLDRGVELVVAELGAMRADAAYAPIDPAYPPGRRADMAAVASARVVVTRTDLVGPWCDGLTVVAVDAEGKASEEQSLPGPSRGRSAPDRLAYSMFTSGSSGRPKGVGVSHRGALHIVAWSVRRYGYVRADRVAQISGPSFDAAVIEIWTAFTVGASVHVPSQTTRLSPVDLLAWYAREGVTLTWTPTPLGEALVAEPEPPGLALRYLQTGGDRLHRGAPGGASYRLSNHYGPVENSVYMMEGEASDAVLAARGPGALPTIGRPVDGITIYVLDRSLAMAPRGAPGELVSGGRGVARGYLGDPAHTADRFRPDPFAELPGGRMYRTGDRVRVRLDGEVDFLGRIDTQVKIRGQRIELGEIESALLALPAVREAAALVREEPGRRADRKVVAYVVLAEEGVTDQELIEPLADRLADAMVPRRFVRLDALPVNPSGKIDRRALAALPLAALPAAEGQPAADPTESALEAEIAALWADFLDLPRVGRDDDFFVLGGHSLLAARLVYRMREALGVELPVAALFEAPTVAGIARRVERMRRADEPQAVAAPPIGRALRSRPIPLSLAQERLWFIEQLEGPSALYHIPAAFSAEGELDFAALSAALSAIWSRHEALRARFYDSEEGPVQSFAPPGRAPLFLADLSALAPERSATESARARSAEGRRPFDLARGPLLRALAIRRSARRHDLALVFHHLVADGVSLLHVERELSMLYAWALGGPLQAPPPLSPLALGYGDVAAWQRAQATEEWLAPRLAAQIAELSADDGAAIEPLELPADRPRAAVSRHRGANLPLAPQVDGEAVSRALASLSARFGTTAFQTWFAAFGALLARLSGRELLAIGLPASGRTAETEPLVGLFADTRVARAGLPGDPSAADLIRAARARLVATEARGEVPFERLVDALDPARLRSVAPLFQAALVSRPATGRGLHLRGLDLLPIDLEIETAKWDLTLYVDPQPGSGAAGGAEYDADLFDRATVARWLGQLGRLLADMAGRPDARLSELALLSEAERSELLAASAGPAPSPVPDGAVQLDDLVARWAEATPEALAVVDPNGRLTYAGLVARANRLAWRLRALGVAEDDRVAICLDRSVDLIVAQLGAMRAGAAYAPIDPAYPEERRGDMVALSGASVVVTRTDLAGAWCGEARVLALDAEAELRSVEPLAAPPRRRDPESLAYAIFTSGSTGRPKGVAMSHRGALHVVSWHLERFGWRPSDRGSQVSGPSFDAAVIEIWPALVSGASLHVPSSEARHEAASLLSWFAAERLSIGWVPTPIYDLLAVEPHPADLALRFLQTGGDRLLRGAPAGAPYVLCNQYGPAENAVVTTQGESSSEGGLPGEVPPIGRPIPGVRVYVADRRLALAPRGVPGELMASGSGLARGYLSDPAQTAERFVPDPFAGEPGARMYRTGDRARLRPDGRLEFLGRIDRQVKIRGQRIELGEIEAALLSLPGVKEAAVAIHERPADARAASERRLVAFVVAEPEAPQVTDRELIAALRLRLAEAMVPRSFVHLAELPLTANGKVDRRALERLALVSSGAGDSGFGEPAGEPPRGEIENEIAAIWSDLLELPAVGRDDNFFDLGGHSLLATRAAQRLRRTFGIEMPLSVLFDQPTLAALGRWIGEAAKALDGGEAREPSIPRADRSLPLPLSFAQERLWLLDRFEPESSTYTIPAAIRLSGPLEVPALRAAVGLLAERHESLRTTFALAGDRPVQRIADRGSLALPLADLRALSAPCREPERVRLYERLAALPFDLERGPLARFRLLRTGEGEHALLLALHHSIADGWSIGVLVRDLAALYGGGVSGLPAVLPALAIQVADHAVWQRGALAGESLAHRLAHWRTLLAGAPPALELPLDRPRPAVRTFSGMAASQVLDPELSDGVRRLAREGGATLFMTLLAAFSHQLGRLAGQDDVVIGTPAAERDRPEIEGLIGMFLNTLVLRLGLGADGEAPGKMPSFRELIRRTRERVLDAFAHEVPFERLLDEVQPARDLSRTPLFQAFFNMVNLPEIRLAIEGLAIEPLAAPEASAKFDLTVYAAEAEGKIRLEWVYNSALFGPERIAAMLDQYRELLCEAVAEPDRPAAELSLVARSAVLPDPRAPLSDSWAGAVTERFAAWAAEAPGRLAVEDPTESVSYGELAARSFRLARRLRRDGVEKGDVVAILGHRSARLVSAVLGVLEAGAAFTILDPAHPPTRLADTLRLARPRGFLALEAAGPVPAEVRECLDGLLPASRLLIPAAGSASEDPTAGEPALPTGIELGPDDVAYLSFTSGSTGVPKGILGRHGPLSHFVPWQVRRFGFGPEDRYSMLSGLAHDPLQRDLFTPLQTGAAVVAPVPGDIAIPGRLAAWMRDRRITVAHLTPAMGQILCEPAPGQPPVEAASLSWAFFVGDVLTRRDVARLVALAPNVRVVNYYGSTETQRSVGYHAVVERAAEGEAELAKQSLPLGRGIEDVQLLVVNRFGRLAGVGEVGEILVRSPHLAAGYVGDPEGTAARFTTNPLSDPGDAGGRADRVYRTGDLGRYLPDGEVEFAGRGDVQVKIRGFRIEPGEIEAFLGRHPAVRECVVVARERPGGKGEGAEKRLIAYVVLDGVASSSELRAFLKSRLPEYMVPAVFAILEKLPVNPNGKVDRKALPEPVEEARGGAAPQTEIERTLAAILREVLGVEKVGRDDNFFELGGNSLQMVKVHARVQEVFGADLQVVQLFTNPTVGALAAFLTQGEAAPRPAVVVEDRSEKLATGRDRLKRRLVQRKTEGEQG